MFLNKNPSDKFHTNGSKALTKLSKLFFDFKNQELSSIEESEQPPSTILLREFSKPILDTKKLNHIKNKGTFPKIKNPNEERNIKLILDAMKKHKGYEQFMSLHKINEKSIMIMCALGNIESYKIGETIYAKKDMADKFYYIIKGKVSIKSIDQKKVMDEYENKIQDYKNKIEVKSHNNFFNTYNNNIKLIENNKNISPISSINSISNSLTNNENSFSGSSILNNKSKDLLHNKIQQSEKEKFSSKKKVIGNINFDNAKVLNEVIISKRRKPLFYINSNDNNNDNNKLIENEKDKNTNNDISKSKDLYSKSFSELQHIINEQREQGQTINDYEEGNFFGEWELMYKKYRQNSSYAIEDVDLLVLDLEDFKDYFKNEMLLADFERKFFLKKTIPILNINYLPIMIPYFYCKGDVIYTEFDIANCFYIIYKGSGVLKQLKFAKNKKDIMLNLNKLETLMIIDKGCIVGLECCKDIDKKKGNGENIYYDNTFVINEENTLLYKINLEKFKINKEEIVKIKYWMKDLYKKQSRLIRNCKEKFFKPKIDREMLLKNIENKNRKYFYYRDPQKNTIINSVGKNNNFPVKKESINININISDTFNKNKFSSLKKENDYLSKYISKFNSYSKRSSFSHFDSSSGSSQSNSKEKAKSTQRKSKCNIYKTVEPFKINDEFISNKKSFNPINKRNSNINDLNQLGENKNALTYSSSDNKFNEINDLCYKIGRLRNAKTKTKNNNINKNDTFYSFKKQKYDDSFYKLIFKKHYRKVAISSNKKGGKKKINIFLYDSGQFDIPLLALGAKNEKTKKIVC